MTCDIYGSAKAMSQKILTVLLTLFLLIPLACAGEEEEEFTLITDDGNEIIDTNAAQASVQAGSADAEEVVHTARDAFIDKIIDLGRSLYEKSGGKAQRAHYKGDIYVCKNFTVYLFRQNRDAFRIAEYPDVPLVIPDNLPAAQCKPYAYGFLWKDIPPEKGNPFYVAAQFRYDSSLTKVENMEQALSFMKQVKKGDFFQMSADYEYGVGAHSAIMIADYDPQHETVHWMDSNMRGKKVKGIRYGIVQFDEEREISWWASAFCHKKRGATLYRLRDDIIYAEKNGE